MTYSRFLRIVLKLDCLSCLAMAALLVPGAATLAGAFGLPKELLREAGLMLIPIGLFIGWLGMRGHGPAALVGMVVAGNIAWTLSSLATVALLPAMTPIGTVFVAVQALAVLVIALLEWRGLRQSSAVVA